MSVQKQHSDNFAWLIGKTAVLFGLIFLFLSSPQTSFSQQLLPYSCLVDRIDLERVEAAAQFDRRGLIAVKGRYHPLKTAQYGLLLLHHFDLTGDSTYWKKASNQILYFLDSTKTDLKFDGRGIGLPYTFKFWDLQPKWYSGMAQGMAISFLLRYAQKSGDSRLMPIIEKIAFFMLQPQENGGTLSTSPEGHAWIEEYPNSKTSPGVLNGFINGLIGLKEYCDFFPHDSTARAVHDDIYAGLLISLEKYDKAKWGFYNRALRILSPKYLRYEIYQMAHLYAIYGEPLFERQRRIWAVWSYEKPIKEKGAYIFPHHDIVLPAKELSPAVYGRPFDARWMVGHCKEVDRYSSMKDLQSEKPAALNAKSRLHAWVPKTVTGDTLCDSWELFWEHPEMEERLNEMRMKAHAKGGKKAGPTMKIFRRTPSGNLEPLAANFAWLSDRVIASFDESPISQLVFVLETRKKAVFEIQSMRFAHSKRIKPPFYLFRNFGHRDLQKGQPWLVHLPFAAKDKAVVFYRYAESAEKLERAHWRARQVAHHLWRVPKSGTYEFQVVWDYEDACSRMGDLKLQLQSQP